MSRAQSKGDKAKKMANYLKENNVRRSTSRCPVCSALVETKSMGSHIQSCKGRR